MNIDFGEPVALKNRIGTGLEINLWYCISSSVCRGTRDRCWDSLQRPLSNSLWLSFWRGLRDGINDLSEHEVGSSS